jgi:D-arginine dehydrogenase
MIGPDIVVIGAGMAGAAVAAHLSEHARVRLLEMEAQPGYHSTGRSAAVFYEAYGNEQVRALTRASRSFLYSPPAEFCAAQLVKPRGILLVARHGQESALRRLLDSAAATDDLRETTALEATRLHPLLRAQGLSGGLYTERCADIEVNELHRGYLRLFQSRGGTLSKQCEVTGLEQVSNGWQINTSREVLRADIVINAAGAWADEIAQLAGLDRIGLQPLKRTACLIPVPTGVQSDGWPMLVDVEESFYLKPDAGAFLLSPADETLTPPGDVHADDMDIAVAVSRLEEATTLNVDRVTHRWAGLRSFVADRTPVIGFDPSKSGFFWVAALGGYGIQTAPTVSRLAAALVLGSPTDADLAVHGVIPSAFSPQRLTRAGGSSVSHGGQP